MDDISKQLQQEQAAATSLNTTVTQLYQKLSELNKLYEDNKGVEKTAEGYKGLQKELNAIITSLTALNAIIDQQDKAMSSAKSKTDIWGKAYEGATGKLESLGKILGSSSDGLKPLADNMDKATKVVNPFKDAIVKANQAYTTYTQGVLDGKSKMESLKDVFPALTKGVEAGSTGMRTFKVALAETGIGLIVIAVAALMQKLEECKPVMDAINAVTASIGAVMGTLANSIVGMFTDPIGTIKNFGKSMTNAATDAYKLSKAQAELTTALSTQEVVNEKLKNRSDILKKQAENNQLSVIARKQALQDAQTIDEKYFKQNGDLAKQAMANAIKDAQIKGSLHKNEVANLQQKGTEYARILLETGHIDQQQFDEIKKADL